MGECGIASLIVDRWSVVGGRWRDLKKRQAVETSVPRCGLGKIQIHLIQQRTINLAGAFCHADIGQASSLTNVSALAH